MDPVDSRSCTDRALLGYITLFPFPAPPCLSWVMSTDEYNREQYDRQTSYNKIDRIAILRLTGGVYMGGIHASAATHALIGRSRVQPAGIASRVRRRAGRRRAALRVRASVHRGGIEREPGSPRHVHQVGVTGMPSTQGTQIDQMQEYTPESAIICLSVSLLTSLSPWPSRYTGRSAVSWAEAGPAGASTRPP